MWPGIPGSVGFSLGQKFLENHLYPAVRAFVYLLGGDIDNFRTLADGAFDFRRFWSDLGII